MGVEVDSPEFLALPNADIVAGIGPFQASRMTRRTDGGMKLHERRWWLRYAGRNWNMSTSARAVTDVGANVLACGFRGSLKRDLAKQFGVPLAVGRAGHEFVIGDQQIRSNIVHGCGPLVDYVGGVEIMSRRGPQSPAGLPKLTGRGSEIALQTLRDPGD
jgi:hypothetical protein